MISQRRLKKTLDELCASYTAEFRRSPKKFFSARRDPILFPHRYQAFEDIEAAAFLAATFAYGNVTSLCAFVERLLALLQPSPFQFLRQGPEAVQTLIEHRPYYRLHKSSEILSLLKVLSGVYTEHRSLYQLFLDSYCNNNRTIKEPLSAFVGKLREREETSLKFLLASPKDGSPCKRLNLFLRWMVRRNGIDFGLWREVSPANLIMPLDTHIGRVAYRLGWIKTPSLTWKKAEQVTTVLRTFDPDDPTRYDFALCHESISKSAWLKRLTVC